MNAAQAIVNSLIEQGIKVVFGMTGDTILPLLDALDQRKDEIRYVTTRFETGTTSMADAYARVTGGVGVCALHVGPSVSNSVMGIWSALKDSAPLMMLSSNMDTFRLERNIWHEFDVMGVFSKVTKYNEQVREAKDVNRIMRKAFQIATSGRPGAVHIDVPKDIYPRSITIDSTDLSLKGRPKLKQVANRPRAEAWAVDAVLDLIQSAKAPVIACGNTVRMEGGQPVITKLAEALSIPVMTTEVGRGVISEFHPLASGPVGHFGTAASNQLMKDADLVIGLDFGFINVNLINWSLIKDHAKIVQVERDPSVIGDQYEVDLGIHADAVTFAQDLLDRAVERGIANPLSEDSPRAARVKELIDDQWQRFYKTDLDATPIKPQLVTKLVEEVFDDDTIFLIGMGYNTQFGYAVRVKQWDQSHSPAGSGSMGWALPAAIGAKLAAPDRQVVTLLGDGDFGMNSQDLVPAGGGKTPLPSIIFTLCSFGALR
ncbi:MAG: thiamine pyrophosphate-binding protein, partial [Sphingomonadaceae bacterium]|nr:thiamine pyrophosphate-binding protein [Sphingomonadaceae bacterium]